MTASIVNGSACAPQPSHQRPRGQLIMTLLRADAPEIKLGVAALCIGGGEAARRCG